jgi:hypothetical protein
VTIQERITLKVMRETWDKTTRVKA